MPQVDILVFAPHPDDAELCCGGLLIKARDIKLKLCVIDLTRGELGTRGSVAIRSKEAAAASRMLKLQARENLAFRDGKLADTEKLRTALVRMLRKYRPKILLAPHWEDQHPDHSAVGQASIAAAYLAGVPKFDARSSDGVGSRDRLPYRPQRLLHYNNRYGIKADVVIDISNEFDEKMKLVGCYASQFGPAEKFVQHPQTRLSNSNFFDWLRGIHLFYGFQAGVKFGEAYCVKNPLAIGDVKALL